MMRATGQRPLPWAKRDGANWEAPPRQDALAPSIEKPPLTMSQALRLAAGSSKGWSARPSLRQRELAIVAMDSERADSLTGDGFEPSDLERFLEDDSADSPEGEV